jgi:UPF0042 nucleotide-binding protein
VTQAAAPMRSIDIVVVTGMSGSGKSTAIDVRDAAYAANWPRVRTWLESQGHRVFVVFLDTSDEVLLRRFSETRRAHPLGRELALPEAIKKERDILSALRENADALIDTSDYNVHELKGMVIDAVARTVSTAADSVKRPAITLRSFGYKYGAATDADLVFDVRFIPNPYFVESLRPLTGLDPGVRDYVLGRDETTEFLERITDLMRFLLPKYAAEGKAYLTIALGCTGGRHRSVVLAEQLAQRLNAAGFSIRVRHRDLDRAIL